MSPKACPCESEVRRRLLALCGLGQERASLLLTNQMTASARQHVDRCIRRMVIENAIADTEDFCHMDAPFAVFPIGITLDLQLTRMVAA